MLADIAGGDIIAIATVVSVAVGVMGYVRASASKQNKQSKNGRPVESRILRTAEEAKKSADRAANQAALAVQQITDLRDGVNVIAGRTQSLTERVDQQRVIVDGHITWHLNQTGHGPGVRWSRAPRQQDHEEDH